MTTGRINQVTFLVGREGFPRALRKSGKKTTPAKHTKALRRATQAFVLTNVRLESFTLNSWRQQRSQEVQASIHSFIGQSRTFPGWQKPSSSTAVRSTEALTNAAKASKGRTHGDKQSHSLRPNWSSPGRGSQQPSGDGLANVWIYNVYASRTHTDSSEPPYK